MARHAAVTSVARTSRAAEQEGRVRLNLEFPERLRARLEPLRALSEADSLTEVVRRAIALYDVMLMAVRDRGVTIVLRSRDGTEREAPLPVAWTRARECDAWLKSASLPQDGSKPTGASSSASA